MTIQEETDKANVNMQLKVLIADDEPQNIKDIFEVLKKENYQLLVAPNGKIAVEVAEKHRPQAIIMDWDMPEMDGIEAVKMLRCSPGTKLTPIIMATGKMTTPENLQMALESGANDFIRKPFDNIEIIARVKSMISLNQEHQENINLHKEISQQQIERIKYQLEINSQALSTLKLKIITDAEGHEHLIKSLNTLRDHVTETGGKMISKIISSYKAKSSAVNWDELESLFVKVHHSFYNNLQSRIPDLSPAERRLCGLIKLNMTTKEISAVSNQSADTIKKTKYRLKKKLGLDAADSLNNFIHEIS
ncbi:MAG TPA: hypothetical protein DEO70_00730 [Bacteroidales bacterium]|nr:MAG: hypothetical protein A2X11_04765 [Bacteroidetes bacterium GWE2_42_24]OFY30769.1 MAG: hypothetical protein A2X09_16860 [Bacteroidetes bacterium GWF2_43_11]HBZ65333.1 hypothetical protein [Bacteroidales bacterium]